MSRLRRAAAPAVFVLAVASAPAAAQEISNLEAARPVTMEDATPIERGTYSASADYAYARRLDNVDYAGPAFSFVAGALTGVEIGADTRLLTNPRLNASRGNGSGDLDVHALAALRGETSGGPALAVRGDAILATGFASHGTNVSAELIGTHSFEGFRLNAAMGDLYVGSTRPEQRRNRVFGWIGFDARPFGPWRTDTLAMVDVVVRQSIATGGRVSVGPELGIRHRIGLRTLFYAGMGFEVAGERNRVRYSGLLGLTHIF
ncbi:MAG TPA: hypothetical protein VFL12_01595 [Thermoanaerobaculia bacterium]|nr:hypothetical protein [Thermoanaerobaculia bacterium]